MNIINTPFINILLKYFNDFSLTQKVSCLCTSLKLSVKDGEELIFGEECKGRMFRRGGNEQQLIWS